ncbi:MAG: glycosyltransferase [Halobacteriota archaeon]
MVSVKVLPNGVDTGKFRPIDRDKAKEWFEQKFKLDDNLNIVFVGRFSPEKGVEYLIKSLEYLEGKLFLAGGGPQESHLRRIAEKFGDKVQFIGKVKHEEIPLLHNATDVFVLPSISMEGFSNSMLEALACGLPVVATPVGAAPDVVTSEVGVVVEMRSARAIADGIVKVRDLDREKIHYIVKENYSFDVVADKVYELYTEINGHPESVCFASLFAPPYVSGAGTQVFELSKALSKKCETAILCGLGGEGDYQGVELIKVRAVDGWLSRPTYSLNGVLKILGYNFDVVDGRNWEGGLVSLAAKRRGSKAVMSLRGEGAIGNALWKKSVNKFIMKRIDCVTATDSTTAEIAERLFE